MLDTNYCTLHPKSATLILKVCQRKNIEAVQPSSYPLQEVYCEANFFADVLVPRIDLSSGAGANVASLLRLQRRRFIQYK